MEYCWTLRGHNGNSSPNHAWESRDPWTTFPLHNSFNYPPPATAADSSVSAFHALMLDKSKPNFFNPDPHLTCLKLGKRHYFEDGTPPPPPPPAEPFSMSKRGKSYTEGASAAVVPRCQVEGCAAVLVNAKDYHRRHKVCEIHAKAPKVVVLGMEQRFCQQCSRFHGVAEFDEAKRSCRRRLAGHNERRRKSSQEQNALARRHSQGRETELVNNINSECALSLLSSKDPWNGDLAGRCSAALRELIAENRASILGSSRQIEGSHVTLNLMQMQPPNSAFGLLSMHDHNNNKSSKEQEHCSDLWKLPLGY